jgi:hypothetical protein
MFMETSGHGGEPLHCKGCERPIFGPDVDGFHPACERPFKSLRRALDVLARGGGQ